MNAIKMELFSYWCTHLSTAFDKIIVINKKNY